MLEVQKKACKSCIYGPRSASRRSIVELEAECADPNMAGFFDRYRACHSAPDERGVCCAGFWRRHKNNFAAGQIARRLGLLRFVTVHDLRRAEG
jgi:hypothetical protein